MIFGVIPYILTSASWAKNGGCWGRPGLSQPARVAALGRASKPHSNASANPSSNPSQLRARLALGTGPFLEGWRVNSAREVFSSTTKWFILRAGLGQHSYVLSLVRGKRTKSSLIWQPVNEMLLAAPDSFVAGGGAIHKHHPSLAF